MEIISGIGLIVDNMVGVGTPWKKEKYISKNPASAEGVRQDWSGSRLRLVFFPANGPFIISVKHYE